jgi:hypothetical protein
LTEIINRVLATAPCVVKSTGFIARLEDSKTTNFNPDSYPLTHPDATSLPYYLLEWDSSVLSYPEFIDTVINPIHAALAALTHPNNNDKIPLSQLLSFSFSAFESFFHQQQYHLSAPYTDPSDFGQSLRDNGILSSMIAYWATNPSVEGRPLFDTFKHLNRTDSLQKALELNSSKGMRDQFATSVYADLPLAPSSSSTRYLPQGNSGDENLQGLVAKLRSELGALQAEKESLLKDFHRLEAESNTQVEDNRTLMKQLEKLVFELNEQQEGKGEQRIQDLERELQCKAEETTAQSVIIQAHLESILRLQNELEEIKAKSLRAENENATLVKQCAELQVGQRTVFFCRPFPSE